MTSRTALSEQRLSLSAGGKARYQLNTPYNNGTTHVVFKPHVVFEALDFLARLADRAFVMDDGCIAREVDRDKRLNDPTLVYEFPGSGSEES